MHQLSRQQRVSSCYHRGAPNQRRLPSQPPVEVIGSVAQTRCSIDADDAASAKKETDEMNDLLQTLPVALGSSAPVTSNSLSARPRPPPATLRLHRRHFSATQPCFLCAPWLYQHPLGLEHAQSRMAALRAALCYSAHIPPHQCSHHWLLPVLRHSMLQQPLPLPATPFASALATPRGCPRCSCDVLGEAPQLLWISSAQG